MSKLIVFEATDGAGKQTQTELLKDYIEEHYGPCSLYAFPRYETPTGKLIKAALYKKDIPFMEKITLFANDRLAARDEILNDLAQDKYVICDRYITSMIVYALAEYSIKFNYRLTNTSVNNIARVISDLELKQNKLPIADVQVCLLVANDISKKLMTDRTQLDLNEMDDALQRECLHWFKELKQRDAFGIAKTHLNIDCNHDNSIKPINIIHSNIVVALKHAGILN